MIETEDLGRLESVVEKLLGDFNELRNEKNKLETLLQQKNSEIDELQESLDKVHNDRTQVHQRVSGILSSIEKWEQHQSPKKDQAVEETEEKNEEKPGNSPQLFSMNG
jgi:chromosome segregation ATPase